MAGYEQEMAALDGGLEAGYGEAHELRQQAVAVQETEASEDGFRAEEDTLAGPSQLVLGTTGAPDGEIETEDSAHVKVHKHGRTATDDGRAHTARQTVRGSLTGSFTLERRLRQKRTLSSLLSVSLSNPETADDQHPEGGGEAESPIDSTENDAEDERISTASIAQVNVGPSGKPHISLCQVFNIVMIFFNNSS